MIRPESGWYFDISWHVGGSLITLDEVWHLLRSPMIPETYHVLFLQILEGIGCPILFEY